MRAAPPGCDTYKRGHRIARYNRGVGAHTFVYLAVLVTFLIPVTKVPDKSNLNEEGGSGEDGLGPVTGPLCVGHHTSINSDRLLSHRS